jgi:hypothetical protein|tara:strand:+ start:1331 stop:1507 length:177 start_codon:yes stop_codon:yes gene_type:complete
MDKDAGAGAETGFHEDLCRANRLLINEDESDDMGIESSGVDSAVFSLAGDSASFIRSC